MDEKRIIEMIDEYIAEPNCISREWVEALTVCRAILVEKAQYTTGFLGQIDIVKKFVHFLIDKSKMGIVYVKDIPDFMREFFEMKERG